MTGYIKLHRTSLDHPIFRKEPYTEVQAWIWLIAHVYFKDATVRVENYVVDVKRGQILASPNYLAKIWDWHSSKVRRFLKRLCKCNMIDIQTDKGISVICLTNYDTYQFTNEGTDKLPTNDRQPTDNKIKNVNKGKEIILGQKFEDIWNKLQYKRGSKKRAYNTYKRLINIDDTKLVTLYNNLCKQTTEKQYIPHFSTWLNDERYNEETDLPKVQPVDPVKYFMQLYGSNIPKGFRVASHNAREIEFTNGKVYKTYDRFNGQEK